MLTSSLATLAAAALLGAFPAASDSPSPYEAAVHLSGKIGSRSSTSKNERRAHQYVARQFRAAGLDTRVNAFTVKGRGRSQNVVGRLETPASCLIILIALTALAIAFVASISATLILLAGKGGIDKLLTGLVLIDAVFFGLTGLALIVLRRKRPGADRPVRTPLYPFVPILFLMFECLIIYGAFRMGAAAAWIGVLWIAASVACYALFFRRTPA